jgi:S-layer family protein
MTMIKLAAAIAAGSLLGAAPRAAADENAFGTAAQELWVPAQAFAGMNPIVAQRFVFFGDKYVVVSPESTGEGEFSAQVSLEAGAHISRLDCDFHAHPTDLGHVYLRRQLQAPGHNLPVDEELAHIHTPVGMPIYVQIGTSLNHTVQARVGTSTAIYFLDVIMGDDTSHELRFRGCRITWNRQVSPAPATARFSDVPPNHPAFRFVEALAASGITGGCGAGTYCPDAPLTRAQMAIFLSVALGLHFPF